MNSQSYLHETLAAQGAFDSLEQIQSSSSTRFSATDLWKLMGNCGVVDPHALLQDFVGANIMHRDGERFAITLGGVRACLLLEAINGGDLRDIYRRLAQLDSTLRLYELIREGMTKAFLLNINERPGFLRLYICSPWISLDTKQTAMLAHAVSRVEEATGDKPEIIVITRPEEKTDDVVPSTLKAFQDLGANIFLTKRLHTKLYIREPDRSGGYSMAIVGSQNLTRSNYLELGIRINSDSRMINQLIRYFWEITYHCNEVKR